MDSDMQMRIGEIVVLKSGSTRMTIEALLKDGRALCVWSDDRQKVKRAAFHVAALRPMPK